MTASNESFPISFVAPEQYDDKVNELQEIANYVRRDAFQTVLTAENGHLGGSSSSTELLTALYFGGKFNFDPDDPQHPNRDQVLIRGHAGPARYPIFSLLGYLDREELSGYRQLGTRLQGHEDMHITPGVDITPSGSLGMLLSYGVGAAAEIKNRGDDSRVIVFLGDGEEQEGNVSEAARHATQLDINNLICIIDKNAKQLSRATELTDGTTNLKSVWSGYGWNVLEIKDGHNIAEILSVYDQLQSIIKPTFVIANTLKGKGIPGNLDNVNGYHTLSTCPRDVLKEVVKSMNSGLRSSGAEERVPLTAKHLVVTPPRRRPQAHYTSAVFDVPLDDNTKGLNIEDGQTAYFSKLTKTLAITPDAAPFYALTPDYIRRDVAISLGFEGLKRFYDTGLREQHTISMAHGISVTNPDARIFAYTGDAFAFRAFDQINAAAQGNSNILLMGGDSGISNDRNGRSHQSTAQPGALMQVPELTHYEPADVQDLFNVLNGAFTKNDGFTYVRLHGQVVPPLERSANDEKNVDSYVVHDPDKLAKFVIAASGFVVANAILAAREMEVVHGIPTRVVNIINQKTIGRRIEHYLDSPAPVLTVYNGNPITLHSNLSAAVMGSSDIDFRPKFIAAHGFTGGTSGKFEQLERYYQLDVQGIINRALQSLIKYRDLE
jgi:transketolase